MEQLFTPQFPVHCHICHTKWFQILTQNVIQNENIRKHKRIISFTEEKYFATSIPQKGKNYYSCSNSYKQTLSVTRDRPFRLTCRNFCPLSEDSENELAVEGPAPASQWGSSKDFD